MPEPDNAWQILEEAFPARGRPAAKLRFLLRYAALAPSGHNTQPWLFRIRDDTVELYADRTRALPVADPDDRELTISCGAALFHLRIAIRHFGYSDELKIFPRPRLTDLLARVRLGPPREPSDEEHTLFRAITRRRTYRLPFEGRTVPGWLLLALEAAVTEEDAWLHLVEGEAQRRAMADLVAEGDRRQMSNKQFRRELAAWVHSSRNRDGMPGYALGFSELTDYTDFVTPIVSLAIRAADLGKAQAAKDRDLVLNSPVLVVVGTGTDEPRAWLAAGQALARLLLRARVEGVFASYMHQPLQLPELRPKVGAIIGRSGFPQLVLRLGYGAEIKPTPRRRVEEMLLE